MQATVEFFMQQFVEITQHALFHLCRIMHRQPFAAVMIVMIIFTAPVRASDSYESDSLSNVRGISVRSHLAPPGRGQGDGAKETSVISRTLLTAAPTVSFQGCIPAISSATDRLWLVSTRHLGDDARCIHLDPPNLRVSRLDAGGNGRADSLDSLFSQLTSGRPLVIHVHGNRMTDCEARERGRFIHRNLAANLGGQPIDFVIFSWPSERTGVLVRDGRDKAIRTEAEGLYFAWLLRELVIRDIPVTVIGYSFGCRVATGALHALAGGCLSGHGLPGETIRGANIGLGLVAPALDENALASGQYHGLASQNIRQMALFYNPRDVILRRYWLIDLATRGRALGYSGPKRLAAGFDGSPIPLVSRDCSPYLGIRHSEIEYYTQGCRAGRTMAALVRTDLR